MPHLYTRTGDSGESSTKNGRFRKDALVFDVLGDLDELNSHLGAVKAEVAAHSAGEAEFLTTLQRTLLALSADLAGFGVFRTDLVPRLEAAIDRLTPPEPFVLRPPEGAVHVVRTVCRRAERHLVAYAPHHVGLPFVNRLSDYLYALAETLRKEALP